MTDSTEVRIVNEATGGEKGQKDDRFDLIPAIPMRLVARHYGIGAKKYEDRNWERGYDWGLSIGALERHLNAFKAGEDIDEETGSPHLAAVVFHALALLEFGETHPQLDNRAKREPTTPAVDVVRDDVCEPHYMVGQKLTKVDYARLPEGSLISYPQTRSSQRLARKKLGGRWHVTNGSHNDFQPYKASASDQLLAGWLLERIGPKRAD